MLEILGKPPEYIKESLENIIKEMGKQKNVRILTKKIAEPRKIEHKDAGEVFTTFAEIEIETGLNELLLLTFTFMPSHVDIITPENLKIENTSLNSFFTELLTKLHQYDEVARTVLMERQNLLNQFQEAGLLKTQPAEQTIKKTSKKSRKKKN